MMATPLYEEEMSAPSPSSCMYDKKNLKLDFSNVKRQSGPDSSTAVLTTPDLKMLQLASPELEKFIINSVSLSGATPTITPLYTKSAASVTEEQEIYARGFLEALQRLQQQDETGVTANEFEKQFTNTTTQSISSASRINTDVNVPRVSSVEKKTYTQLSTISNQAPRVLSLQSTHSNFTNPGSTTTATVTSNSYLFPLATTAVFPDLSVLKTENPLQVILQESNDVVVQQPPPFVIKSENEQIVPTMTPIDLRQQEMAKNERKKQRNREAAAKCRMRKIHREQDLENKVKILKKRKSELNDIAVKLRKEVCVLKEKVMEHIGGGCTVMLQRQTQGLENPSQQSFKMQSGILSTS